MSSELILSVKPSFRYTHRTQRRLSHRHETTAILAPSIKKWMCSFAKLSEVKLHNKPESRTNHNHEQSCIPYPSHSLIIIMNKAAYSTVLCSIRTVMCCSRLFDYKCFKSVSLRCCFKNRKKEYKFWKKRRYIQLVDREFILMLHFFILEKCKSNSLWPKRETTM